MDQQEVHLAPHFNLDSVADEFVERDRVEGEAEDEDGNPPPEPEDPDPFSSTSPVVEGVRERGVGLRRVRGGRRPRPPGSPQVSQAGGLPLQRGDHLQLRQDSRGSEVARARPGKCPRTFSFLFFSDPLSLSPRDAP